MKKAILSAMVLVVSNQFLESGLAAGNEIDNLVLEGTHLIESGHQQQAVPVFTKAIQAAPSRADALLGRARAYQESHQLTLAATDAEAALKAQPDNIWATYRVASIQGDLGDSTTAVNLLTRLIEAKPANLGFLLERSDQYFRLKKYSAALNDAFSVIKLAPTESLAYFRAGCSYRGLKKYSLAQTELEKAIKLEPRDYYIRELGDLLVQTHKYDQAALAYQRGAALNPQDGSWPAKQGVVALLRHQPLKSVLNFLDRAIALSPTNSVYANQRASVLFQLNRKEEALAAVSKSIAMNPREPLNYFRRACFYNSMGDYTKALSDLSSAIKIQPRYYFYSGRADAYMHLAEFERAIADADAALKLEPEDVGSLKVHSFLHALGGNFDQALDDEIEALHSVHSQNNAQGVASSRSALPAPLINQVANSYSELLRLFPDDNTALYNRGFAYLCLGKSAAGASDLEKFAHNSHSSRSKILAAAFANIGYREAGDMVKANAVLKQALAVTSKSESKSFPETLLLYLKGEIKAEAVFNKRLESDAVTQAQCLIGLDLLLKKQQGEGVLYLKKVLKNGDYRLDEYSLAQTRLAKLKQ